MESEDATQMNIGGPVKRQKTDRSFFKCDQCRGRKCKCLPVVRNFDNGERCESCVKLDLPCGPHRRFHSQPAATEAQLAMIHTAPSSLLRPLSTNTFAFQPIVPRFISEAPFDTQNVIGTIAGASGSNGSLAAPTYSATTSGTNRDVPRTSQSAENSLTKIEDEIKAMFNDLTALSDLYPELRDRQYATWTTAPSFAAPRHVIVNFGLDIAATDVCERLLKVFRDIFLKLCCYDGQSQELYWRRLLEHAQSIPMLIMQTDEHEYKVFLGEFWEIKILGKLIVVCDNSGRIAEADHFCHVLVRHPTFDATLSSSSQKSRVQDFYRRKSERMDAQFRKLNLSRKYRPVPDAECNQFPPTHLAIRDNQLWAVDGLQQANTADFLSGQSYDVIGRTLVQAIIETGKPEGVQIVKTLLQQDTSCVGGRDALGMTSTAIAVVGGDIQYLELLMQNSDYLNERDGASRSLLRVACDARQFLAAKCLLEGGMNPDDYCLNEGTTLDAARESNQPELRDLLQRKIAEVNASQEGISFAYSSTTMFSQDDFDL